MSNQRLPAKANSQSMTWSVSGEGGSPRSRFESAEVRVGQARRLERRVDAGCHLARSLANRFDARLAEPRRGCAVRQLGHQRDVARAGEVHRLANAQARVEEAVPVEAHGVDARETLPDDGAHTARVAREPRMHLDARSRHVLDERVGAVEGGALAEPEHPRNAEPLAVPLGEGDLDRCRLGARDVESDHDVRLVREARGHVRVAEPARERLDCHDPRMTRQGCEQLPRCLLGDAHLGGRARPARAHGRGSRVGFGQGRHGVQASGVASVAGRQAAERLALPRQNEEPGSFRNATSSGVEVRPSTWLRCGYRPKRSTMRACRRA